MTLKRAAEATPEPVSRLLTVSNRGPMEYQMDGKKLTSIPGQGGLATALRVAAQLHPTTWLSSPMSDVDRKIASKGDDAPETDGASRFVINDPEAYDLFYGSFSNEVLWFLQHNLPLPAEIEGKSPVKHAWQDGYLPVNRAFADAVIDELGTGTVRAVMFHDYHFYLAPGMVRKAAPDAYLQHFVHIPWPAVDAWKQLDGAIFKAIIEGLLGNDSLVFQTQDDADNFIACAKQVLPAAKVNAKKGTVALGKHTTRVWANAISVDPTELAEEAGSQEFSRYRYMLRPSPGHKTIVRVDRLDVTKNVVRGFQAYERLFELHEELRGRVEFLALLVPSKSDIAVYERYQDETHELVESINARIGHLRWKPIHLFFEHNRIQALAAMSLYDVLLVNALADGMNLVAKEGPMVNMHNGVLVLSTNVGSFSELATGALGIDPEDIDGTAEALYQALTMPLQERRERAARIRDVIRGHDLRAWFAALLADIEEHTPETKVPAA